MNDNKDIIELLKALIKKLEPESIPAKKTTQEWPKAIELPPGMPYDKYVVYKDSLLISELNVDLKGKRILDFGCGDGRLTGQLLNYDPELVVAHDIKAITSLADNIRFYQDLNQILDEYRFNKFDIIIMNDVFDHLIPTSDYERELYVETLHDFYMRRLSNIVDGEIILRCHPWFSKTGGHLQRKMNMAYIHLVLNKLDYDMANMANEEVSVHKLLYPIEYYRNCFNRSGMKIKEETIKSVELNDFIMTDILPKAFALLDGTTMNINVLAEIMKIDYVYYRLLV